MSAFTYQIYIARFPFLDKHSAKLRPVIVVSKPHGAHRVMAIVPVSSKPRLITIDFVISDLDSTGLVKASTAQVHKLSSMLETDLIARLGELNQKDGLKLKKALQKLLKL